MKESTFEFQFTFPDGRAIRRVTTVEAAEACARLWDCKLKMITNPTPRSGVNE